MTDTRLQLAVVWFQSQILGYGKTIAEALDEAADLLAHSEMEWGDFPHLAQAEQVKLSLVKVDFDVFLYPSENFEILLEEAESQIPELRDAFMQQAEDLLDRCEHD